MGKSKYTYEQVKHEFEERNYELLSNEYHNVSEKLEYICLKHKDKGVQKISFSKFHNCNQGCYYCGIEKLSKLSFLSLNEFQKRVYEKPKMLLF